MSKFKIYTLKKHSNRLTRQAKHIFGADIVDSAYFACNVDRGDMHDYYNQKLIDTNVEKSNKNISMIDIDCIRIMIEFKNGNSVSFWSSEWGDISKVENTREYTKPVMYT